MEGIQNLGRWSFPEERVLRLVVVTHALGLVFVICLSLVIFPRSWPVLVIVVLGIFVVVKVVAMERICL